MEESIKLTQEQFDRLLIWNFSNLHLRLKWEDLTDIKPKIIKNIEEYILQFILDKKILFEKYRRGDNPGLFIYSNQTGTAKTSLVHLIAKELLLRNKGIKKMKYYHSVELKVLLKSTFKSGSELHESDVLGELIDVDVLIIDDIDKLLVTSDYDKERMSLIFDTRYRQLKPIILTSNKSLQELKSCQQVEKHIYSRLLEMCNEINIDNKEDYRIKNLKVKRKQYVQ